VEPKITYTEVILVIQDTGVVPISTSRNVPPPTAVTKAIINTPKGSMRLFNAIKTPEIEKATIPNISTI